MSSDVWTRAQHGFGLGVYAKILAPPQLEPAAALGAAVAVSGGGDAGMIEAGQIERGSLELGASSQNLSHPEGYFGTARPAKAPGASLSAEPPHGIIGSWLPKIETPVSRLPQSLRRRRRSNRTRCGLREFPRLVVRQTFRGLRMRCKDSSHCQFLKCEIALPQSNSKLGSTRHDSSR